MQQIKENGIAVVLFVAIAVILWFGFGDAARTGDAESRRILESQLQRVVVNCYALEGSYPESIAYMQEKYGLEYDEKRFIVQYEVVAENIMPEITVIERD